MKSVKIKDAFGFMVVPAICFVGLIIIGFLTDAGTGKMNLTEIGFILPAIGFIMCLIGGGVVTLPSKTPPIIIIVMLLIGAIGFYLMLLGWEIDLPQKPHGFPRLP